MKELEKENIFLKQTIKALEKRIDELEGIVKEKSKPSFIKEDVKEEPKISGQKEGHVGYSRHVPERIDEVKEHKLDRCPNCGGVVSDTQEIRERVVTDIPKLEPRILNIYFIDVIVVIAINLLNLNSMMLFLMLDSD